MADVEDMRFELTYLESQDLIARSMTSWARPHLSGQKKALRMLKFLGVCIGLGVLLGVAFAFFDVFDHVSKGFLIGVLVGFYLGLLMWVLVHRNGVKKLSGFATELINRSGTITASLDAKGVRFKSNISDGWMSWTCFDQVITMKDATVLRAGAVVYPIPDAALPEGTNPDAFREILTEWAEVKP